MDNMCFLTMVEGMSTAGQRTRAVKGPEEEDINMILTSSKPLHRFIRAEARSLGIVVLIFGCAEVLMGFELAKGEMRTSSLIYVPFWQGALFMISGNLSIYTVVHPSKKLVTVCLALYVVTLLGIPVSIGYRIRCLAEFVAYNSHFMGDDILQYVEPLLVIEAILLISSLCVSVLLIFLSVVARLALKSTKTQVSVQHIMPALSDTTST